MKDLRAHALPGERAIFIDAISPQSVPFWKRLMDIVISVIGIVSIYPVAFLILALYIKIVSPHGSVLFRQKRVGIGGKLFTCLKFRTMHVGDNETVHAAHVYSLMESNAVMAKLDNYSGIIPFGKIVRKTCIDELPQLFNVLRGEMSVVGPRPCVPYETEKHLPWHHQRLAVLPGLTGLWQVSGKNRVTFEQMMRMDISYAKNVAFWLDLKIIIKTPFAILRQARESIRKKPVPRRPATQIRTAIIIQQNMRTEIRKVIMPR
jgi:lipopolysaccharide/colanic/teichoic acid biosynthesis glycosyltransferase